MNIEVFAARGCKQCASAQDELRAVAATIAPHVIWRLVNILEELDYAVELGVLNLPSVVIDGTLVFNYLPSANQLKKELGRRKAAA